MIILESVSVVALVLITLWIVLWSLCRVYKAVKLNMWYRSGHTYDNVEHVPAHLSCGYNPEHQAEGKAYLKQCKIVVCGLLRDKAERIRDGRVKQLVHRIVDQFGTYKVLIVENDSTDGTRDLLLEWSKEDPNVKILGCGGVNLPVCELKLMKTTAHSTYAPRIQKMVNLRNVYMDALSEDPDVQDADFVAVIDLDLHVGLFLEGLWDMGYHFKHHPDWSAICANGLEVRPGVLSDRLRYMDTYALRTEEVWNYRKRALDDLSALHWPLRCQVSAQKVVSGFSGLTFYRFKEMKDLKYSMIMDGYNESVCEHISLCLQLRTVMILPSLMMIILNNDL